jgi:hypothetical protein
LTPSFFKGRNIHLAHVDQLSRDNVSFCISGAKRVYLASTAFTDPAKASGNANVKCAVEYCMMKHIAPCIYASDKIAINRDKLKISTQFTPPSTGIDLYTKIFAQSTEEISEL